MKSPVSVAIGGMRSAVVLLLLAAAPAAAEPTVSRVAITSAPADGVSYQANETIKVAVTFSERVTITAARLRLAIGIGSTVRQADFSSLDGDALTFTYTVTASDVDTDGISIAADALTCADVGGNPCANSPGVGLGAHGDRGATAANLALGTHAVANAAAHTVNDSRPTFGAAAVTAQQSFVNTDEVMGSLLVTLLLQPQTISENGGVTTVTAVQNGLSSGVTTIVVEPYVFGTTALPHHYRLSQNRTLTIVPGSRESTGKVTVTAVNNDTDEPHRRLSLNSSVRNSKNAQTGSVAAQVLINDDDDAPTVTLAVADPSIPENGGSTTVTATLSHPSTADTTITVAGASGFYTVGLDATITIAAGETVNASDTVSIAAVDDTIDNPGNRRQVTVMGSAVNRPQGMGAQGIGTVTGAALTLTDDDGEPTLSIRSASVTEGDSGSANLTFAVTLDAASGRQVTVDYADAGTGTATSGTDYTAFAAGTLTFAAGVISRSVTVSVTGDTKDELDETVVVRLISPANATISQGMGTGTGTIRDDDGAPTLAIGSAIVVEGDGGAATLTFPVILSAASGKRVTVGYADALTGTATSGTDYTAVAAGTLTFAAGVTSRSITVSVTGDTTDEPDETVMVSLTSRTNATISTGSGTGTITDDDGAPDVAVFFSAYSIPENGGTFTVRFTLTHPSSAATTVTVDSRTVDTARVTMPRPAQVVIVAGATTHADTIVVKAVDNEVDEPNYETNIDWRLRNAQGLLATRLGQTFEITDDDPAPTLSVGSASVAEGDTGAVNLTFRVTLSAGSGKRVTVGYADALTGTATSGTDYTALTAGTLTFAAGVTSRSVTVSVTGDTTDEPDETVVMALSSATNATISTGTGTGTITDDDDLPTLAINLPSVAEGDSGAVNLTFTVTLSAVSGKRVTVGYADALTGTATSGTDYTAFAAGTLTFAAGTTSRSITVSVTGDTTDEPDETVVVALSSATNATISTGTGTGTITDDDDPPTVSISSASVPEGGSGSTATLPFTVTLSAASSKRVTVGYADALTGTATSGTDYTAVPAGTLTFAAGTTSRTITVSVTGDTTDELDETVVVALSSATNATISAGTGTGTIRDDDAAPTLSISSPSVTEGDGEAAALTFRVRLSAGSGKRVTVGYADALTGTATSGTDYTAVPAGTLTFAAGTTSRSITVSVTGDTTDEPDETVVVALSSATNARISAGTGTGTIRDDDAAPTLSISSPSVTEGDGEAAALTFRVRLSAGSGKRVTVGYADALTGTATSGTDYTAVPAGTLTFAAGTTSRSITVSVTGDTTDEPDETVVVSLSSPTNARIAPGMGGGTGTITDDDAAPTVAIGSASVAEGDGGAVPLTFPVTLSAGSGKRVTVGYADALTGTATSGTDYTAVPAGTLTFAAGTTSRSITVSVTGDTTDEPDETVVVALSSATNATISAGSGTGTITDDDAAPTLSISSPSVTEGSSGAAALTFRVRLSAGSGKRVTVGYADALTGTATSGTDYTAVPAGTLTFAAGTTSRTITVSVTGDTTDELDETVVVALSSATNATISAGSGTGTIRDDDAAPTLSISSPSVTEGDGGAAALTFRVRLSAGSGKRVTVGYADALTGTATSGTDYTAVPAGTLTFAAGTTSRSVTVSVTGDTTDEPDETVVVSLSSPTNARIAPGMGSGTGTITDDDAAPTVAIGSASVAEGDGGAVPLTFPVTLSAGSGKRVTVGYADALTGTTTSGTDYTALTAGTLTFAAGTTSRSITLSVTGDTTDELDETVVVALSSATNATISTGTGTGTIRDDDAAPTLSISSPSVTEGDGGAAALTFRVTLSAGSGKRVTVGYADALTGTATSGTDYTAVPAGTLTFAAGVTSRTITVSVTGDTTDEPDETVVVSLSSPANATISAGSGTGTIRDDDAAPTLSISSPSVTEGASGAVPLTFRVTLSAGSGKRVTVGYADALTGTATSGTDYTAVPAGTLTFAAGTTSRSITVSVTGDTTDEPDETVVVALSSATNATISAGSGTGTIRDDDAAPTLSISSPSVTEGASGAAALTFRVRLSAGSGKRVTVGYADALTGTATSGTDYTAVPAGTLTFAAGTTSRSITVSVTGDTTDELDETVVVSLSSPTNATISAGSGTGTITDDDAAPTLSISSPSVTEGASGAVPLTFRVTLSAGSGKRVTVGYADALTGTATSGTDYTAVPAGTLTFAAGTTSRTITVSVTGDTTDELDETVVVSLNSPANATISAGTGTGTITDDDAAPTLSISSPSVTEGASGSAPLTFRVTLSAGSGKRVTVGYADALTGTATSGTDYTAFAAGTLTFAAGTTSRSVTVSVTGDTTDEPDETVVVSLSSPTNATISAGSGTGTITNDDNAPTLAINSPSVTEGASGAAFLTFRVRLSAGSGKRVTVGYADALTGTATSGTDYTAFAAGTLTFAAGETSRSITVSVTGDTTDEPDETVVVSLSSPANATISAGTGTGTITDDDAAPTLSISSPSVTEGASGAAALMFRVTLSAASSKRVTVGYADALTGTATSGTDYTAFAAGTLTFAAGTTSRSVTVSVTGDTTDELDETVVVSLSSPTNARIAPGMGSGTGTITDDDAAPTVAIGSASVAEGDGGAVPLTFPVTLSAGSGKRVTVGYADALTGTTTSGTDYTALTAGTLTFAAGTTSRSITLSVTGDTTDELDETVVVALSSATNATISTGTGTGTIRDDDAAPTLSISSPSVTEGDGGAAALTFRVTLSAGSGKRVTVGYADALTGTATSGTDYTAVPAGTLTFAAGVTSRTITVSVTGDTTDEPDETVVVSLSSPANATISAGSGTGTIRDDDAAPTLSISSPSVTEGASGAVPLTFRVTLSAGSGKRVTVGYADALTGTATSGTDYTAVPAGTLTFAAGTTSRSITVSVTGDTTDEPDETVVVALSSATNATISAGSGTGTITDDDAAPTLSISSPSVTEGASGAAALTFRVRLSAGSGKRVTVGYADALTGTATSGTDYTAVPAGTLTFAAGTTSRSITVSVTGDTTDELDETVVVSLSSPTNATISAGSGTGTITDDDAAPTLSISSPSVTEGASGAAALMFRVTLSAASSKRVTVGYADALTGTATSGTDYTAVPAGTLTFAAGTTSRSVTVSVTGDTTDEPDETVVVSLSSPTNARIAPGMGSGTGTITDDDAAPTVAIGSASVAEGDGGAVPLTFPVSLSAASGKRVTVAYAEGPGGTATSGTDYTAVPAGTLTFAAGTTSRSITVSVTGDTTDEPDETVVVSLSSPANATISTGTGTGTITDDDDAPTVLISLFASFSNGAYSISESGGTATVSATLSHPSSAATTVTVERATLETARVTVPMNARILIAAGATTSSDTTVVTAVDNAVDAPDSTTTIYWTLANAQGVAVPRVGTALRIIDDDRAFVGVSGATGLQTTEAGGTATFRVRLNTEPTGAVGLSLASSDTSEGTVGPAALTFTAGTWATAQAVTLTGVDDPVADGFQSYTITLTMEQAATADAIYAALASVRVTAVNTDDEAMPALAIDSPSVAEGDSGLTDLTFTVTLSPVSTQAVTVGYADAGTGTATSGTDYTAVPAGTLTFAAGETSRSITVSVTGDTTDEPDETVVVSLSSPANATISAGSGTGTIRDDDAAPTLSISSPNVTEGASGAAPLTFRVRLSAGSGKRVTVGYADALTGTATSGTDYTAVPAGTLTFAAGTTSRTITVSVTGDTTDELDETVVVALSSATNATISAGSGTGTIRDDDAAPTLSISSPSVTEGDGEAAALTFRVRLSAGSGKRVTVGYADALTGTATSGTDYTAVPAGTLTFAAGTTSRSITVSVTGDTTDEPDETVVVSLSSPTNARIAPGMGGGTGTITDDDAAPTVAIGSASVAEGDGGAVPLTFPVTLSAGSGKRVTVGYADALTGTATSGTDYTAVPAGTLTFAAGTTSRSITVSVTGDTTDEPDETVVVALSSATNATISAGSGTGTITDDDAAPTLSISSPSVTEGSSGAAALTFRVRLSAGSGKRVTVGYADALTGTATSGTDYTAVPAGTLTFAAGTTSRTITVSVTGDTTDELDETVVVALSSATNATISAGSGTGTIRDDDAAPTLSISSPSVTEGDGGAAALTFRVRLSAGSGKRVTVGYADALTGTATSGTDYTAVPAGTLTFAAGTTSRSVTVSVTGDTRDEPDETVVVNLSSPTNATISAGSGTGTITNDDNAPTLAINSPSVTEGASGAAFLTFRVSLSAGSGKRVTVGYADALTGTATSGTDYTAVAAGTLTFAAGETSRSVTVSVTGDTTDEPDETVVVSLSSPANATISAGSGTGTIRDDDAAPTVAIGSASVAEGDGGAAALTFRVRLSAGSGKRVTVGYADALTGTATSGTDYTAVAAGTLTFAAGTTSRSVTVSVTGDTTDELDETVVVSLSSPTNATISAGSGTGTITNDDNAPTLAINSPSVTEGASGAAFLTFRVRLSAGSGKRVTVGYADALTGTATSGTDYTAFAAGTLTFAAGETSRSVTVSVTGDTTDEPDETVVVSLSSPANATISAGTGTGTITDDDAAPTLSISSPSVTEGASGAVPLMFRVTLSTGSGKRVTVGYADALTGTATSGTDYTALTAGTLTFAVGTTSRSVTVSVTGDTRDESAETVVVSLSSPANATISAGSGTGTITDDDAAPMLSISSPSVTEGASGAVPLTFRVTLSAGSGKRVTVGYADALTGTATSGTDYTAFAAGTLTFAAGTTSRSVTVSVTGDTTDELDETVVVALSSAMNATISAGTGTGTITNDDNAPTLAINSPSVAEGDGGAAALPFTVTLSAGSGKRVTVGYADALTGTATSGTDYTAFAAGTLTFAAGETSRSVTVSVTGDTRDEPAETVVVSLSSPANAMIAPGMGTGTGTITNDDGAPTLAINSPSVAEGDRGAVPLTFRVTLSAVSGQPVTVGYADALTGTATSGTDYTAVAAGTLTFAAGETSRSITVAVTGDTTDELDETVVVALSQAMNATIATGTGTGRITDDDGAPTVSISSPSVAEGDSSSVNLPFTVTLSAGSGKRVTVGYADALTGTATSGTDYTAVAAGMLTFAAGETSRSVTVAVTGDTTDEADETIVVVLSGPMNATLGPAAGTGTIRDDDGPAAGAGAGPTFGDATIANQRWTQNTGIPAVTLPSARGGVAPVTYELLPGLPTGVTRGGGPSGDESRAAESHVVTGTPRVAQAATPYRWQATDADGVTATLTFTVEVVADARPTFGGQTVAGQRYVQYLAIPALRLPQATGGDGRLTYTLTPRAVPSGLTLDPATRTLAGTPTAVRARTLYTWTVRDADGDAARLAFPVEVVPGVRPHDLRLVLAGVGRTLAADAVAVIGGRGEASAASGVQVTLGGQVLRLTTGGSGVTEPGARPGGWQRVTAVAVGVAQALGVGIGGEAAAARADGGVAAGTGAGLRRPAWQPVRGRPVSGKDLLARSAFELPLRRPGAAGVPRWTLWGRGAASGFSGRPAQDVTVDGTLAGGYVGVDYRPAAAVRLGVALAHSTGSVQYERGGAGEAGEVAVEVTSVLPYAHWRPRPGLGVWGLLGTGWGKLAVDLGGGDRRRPTDVALLLGAVGGRQVLSRLHGVDVAAKGDAFVTTLAAEGTGSLPAARGHAERVRLLLEGRTEWAVGAARLAPRLELGGRWDRGTAERGVGVEVGGGVVYTEPTWGLRAEVQGRYLVAHEEAAFEDWGLGVNVQLDPGVAGEGAYLTVVPVWGEVRSGVEQLWGTAGGVPYGGGRPRPAGRPPAEVDVDVGYGMLVAKGRGRLTPYGGMAVAGPGVSRYRLGSRLTLHSSLALNVEGERAEHPGQATAHGVSVSLGWQW